jgi:hypothetical protein
MFGFTKHQSAGVNIYSSSNISINGGDGDDDNM